MREGIAVQEEGAVAQVHRSLQGQAHPDFRSDALLSGGRAQLSTAGQVPGGCGLNKKERSPAHFFDHGIRLDPGS
jgi:hypothetical protein